MIRKQLSDVYVASCVPDGGILHYRLDKSGKLNLIDKLDLPTPNFIARNGNVMYATLQFPFPESKKSGVIRLRVSEDGSLSRDGEIIPTEGKVSCHLCFDNEDLYTANYISGSVTKIGQPPISHTGHGVNPERQEAPHCHCTFFSPDRRFILVCDLGLDTIFVYDRALNEISQAKVPAGEGCRHLVFSKDEKYVYVINEMGCSITVFTWNDGVMTPLQTYPTRTFSPHDGPDKGSAIKLSKNGKFLYITNRGENQVVILRITKGGQGLRVVSRVDTCGDEPRDFSLLFDEKYALVTNQFGNSITLYKSSKFPYRKLKIIDKLEVPSPLCVIE